MTEPADVTVVIPAFNRAGVLGRALESVRRQTVQPHEVVVVDDGSADGTADVAREAGVHVLVNDATQGSAGARNRGIDAADTTWIAFLDSDDEWLDHHLATVLPAVQGHDLLSAVAVDSFGRLRGNNSGRVLPLTPARLFFPESPICTSGTVARRTALIEAGLFREVDRAEDLDLWLRVLERGTGIAIPDVTSVYHVEGRYLPERLHARNQAGAEAVAADYEGRSWLTESLRRQIRARDRWDALRLALHGRRTADALSAARSLASEPRSLPALVELARHRRRARGSANGPRAPRG